MGLERGAMFIDFDWKDGKVMLIIICWQLISGVVPAHDNVL